MIDALIERERSGEGAVESVATLFLAGRECPFTCVFCDLWRFTLDEPTPSGSLPRQIAQGLSKLGRQTEDCATIKLYNASNFFDPLAVPDEDLDAIIDAVARFRRVVVESHPRLIGDRALGLAERLHGELEVAMGLETVHPEVLPRLNKGMTLSDFALASERLGSAGVGVRAFVLLGVPYLPASEQVDWAVRSAREAVRLGARHVSLIPVRGGNGALETLAAEGRWSAPGLGQLEELAALLADDEGVVTIDLWDLERFSDCSACFGRRRDRLAAMNLTGRLGERSRCRECGWT